MGYGIRGWSGNKARPNGAPWWVVRVYADSETLDALASKPRVKELSDIPVQALNNMFGQNRDKDGWRRGIQLRQS
jgi:hypothetical protein